MKVIWSKGEFGAIITSAIVLGVVIGFDDKRPVFELSYWLTNMITIMFLSFILFFLYIWVQKVAATKFGTQMTTRIWGFARYGYRKGAVATKPFPLGIIIPVLIVFLSRGAILFGATTASEITQKQKHRLGKEHPWVDEFDNARILLAGPLAITIVALIASVLEANTPIMGTIATIGTVIAISNMLPIPKLNGLSIFTCSPPLYVFSFAAILLSVLFINIMGVIPTVILALVLGFGILIVYYYNAH